MEDSPEPQDFLDLARTIALAAGRSVGQAAVLTGAGVYMGRAGHISKAGTKVLSVLSMRVTIPCMLFSRVVPQVSWELLLEAWPMALLPLFFVATGIDPSRLRLELYLQSSEPSRNFAQASRLAQPS